MTISNSKKKLLNWLKQAVPKQISLKKSIIQLLTQA